MKQGAKKLLNGLLGQFGLKLINQDVHRDLVGHLDFLRHFAEHFPDSMSQLGQDLFVLDALGWKREGYFVEFGAADGKTLSNTWLLEKCFGWNGILAEPARSWRKALAVSGRTAAIDLDCVWSVTGETLNFAEAEYPELSTLESIQGANHQGADEFAIYPVKTVSLNDLLERHGAPPDPDYLSIDTEGSEFEILSALDFARYRFRVITCEHNFKPQRQQIQHLLASHGYVRKLDALSRYDDWYVLEG
jgi:FkbM family methyltransferase